MSKTVKGARIRHRRTSVAGVIPTIPANDDHTTGWLDTDIYIGEFFMNTSVTTPSLWFRDVSGATRMATLDKTSNLLSINQMTSSYANSGVSYFMDDKLISTSNLTFNGSILGLTGDLTFSNSGNRTISIANDTTSRTLFIRSNNNTSGSGGSVNIVGGIGGGTFGSGGNINLTAGSSNASTSSNGGHISLYAGSSSYISTTGYGGDINLYAGGGSDYGGSVYIECGYGNINGGSIYINAGYGGSNYGSINIGTWSMSTIYMELPNINTSQAVLYNASTKQLSYGTQTSDIKFKKDLNKITGALDKINEINGYTFKYNDDAKKVGYFDTNTINSGVIAQEVEMVFPEVVQILNIPDSNETFKNVQYDKLIPLLIEGIKELKEIVKQQQIEINNLKT